MVESVELIIPKSSNAGQSNEESDDILDNYQDGENDDDDDDGENVISLNKIKASANIGDENSSESIALRTYEPAKSPPLEIKPQQPFQPGSSPVHLLNRYMVNIQHLQEPLGFQDHRIKNNNFTPISLKGLEQRRGNKMLYLRRWAAVEYRG